MDSVHPDRAEQDRSFALARTIAMVNEKGGVGKTSIVSNLSGQFAAAGYRCLLVDLNRQANVADDLGYRGTDIDDHGTGLLLSIMGGTPLTPARGIRPNLDIAVGGTRLADLVPILVSRVQEQGRAAFRALGDVLAPVADDYDIVFVDCPPESPMLTDLALAAARWIVMPTKSDAGGLVGMGLVAERFALAREINPHLRLLGAVLFDTGSRSRVVHAEARSSVDRVFGGRSPLFDTTIRHAERTAQDARRYGKLAHELELEVAAQPAWWESLRAASTHEAPPRLASSAAGVAEDYRALGVELLSLLRTAEDRESPPDQLQTPDEPQIPDQLQTPDEPQTPDQLSRTVPVDPSAGRPRGAGTARGGAERTAATRRPRRTTTTRKAAS